MTPIPEIAGVGIEYSFGKAKSSFRRKYNDRVAANLLSNAKLAMCPEVELTLDLVRKFARPERDYMRANNNPHNPVAFRMIEDICRNVKSHRGVRSADLGFL